MQFSLRSRSQQPSGIKSNQNQKQRNTVSFVRLKRKEENGYLLDSDPLSLESTATCLVSQKLGLHGRPFVIAHGMFLFFFLGIVAANQKIKTSHHPSLDHSRQPCLAACRSPRSLIPVENTRRNQGSPRLELLGLVQSSKPRGLIPGSPEPFSSVRAVISLSMSMSSISWLCKQINADKLPAK